MDGQYPPHLSYYTHGYPPTMPTEPYQRPPRLHQIQTMSMESMGSYSEFEGSSRATAPSQGTARPRRRQPQGAEHVKHRRTRSGCYTCRQRRVKVRYDSSGALSYADNIDHSAMKAIRPARVCLSIYESLARR